MLHQEKITSLLNRVLNQTPWLRKAGTEAVYFCPFCKHRKKKLEINVNTGEWHCWTCNVAGKSIRTLFKKLQLHQTYFTELYNISGTHGYKPKESSEEYVNLSLPVEFLTLTKKTLSDSFEFGHAISYLRSRNITREDILRYNIGYCENGEYSHRIIIPSYDKDGQINFFSSRAYHESTPIKYKNPPWSKDIIGFELFINWNEPITLVEGSFDAIAIRRNAIPLFGTTMSNALMGAIVDHQVKRVNIVLDSDALKKAIEIYEDIELLASNKIDVHLIKLKDKDPSVMGFDKINDIISSSKPFDFSDLIHTKLYE